MDAHFIQIILGLFAWIGGDAARFTAHDISNVTQFEINSIEKTLLFLNNNKIINRINNNQFEITSEGSKLINESLLYSIFYWNYESQITKQKDYDTIQKFFISDYYKKFDILNIRKKYILDYCNTLINLFFKYDLYFNDIGYQKIRNLIIRMSLFPTAEFVIGKDNVLQDLYYILIKREIIGLSNSNNNGLFIKFQRKILRDLFGKSKKTY